MDVVDRIFSHALLLYVGQRVIVVVQQRVDAGEFLPGSTGTGEYSTTRMPLPFGSLQKAVRTSGTIKEMIRSGEAEVFRSRAGKIWILLEGGYKKFRELAGKETDHVTLNWTGSMMQDLVDIRTYPDQAMVVVGFTNERSKKLAGYHDEEGAGKSRTTHKFLGLTEDEIAQMGEWVRAELKMT